MGGKKGGGWGEILHLLEALGHRTRLMALCCVALSKIVANLRNNLAGTNVKVVF